MVERERKSEKKPRTENLKLNTHYSLWTTPGSLPISPIAREPYQLLPAKKKLIDVLSHPDLPERVVAVESYQDLSLVVILEDGTTIPVEKGGFNGLISYIDPQGIYSVDQALEAYPDEMDAIKFAGGSNRIDLVRTRRSNWAPRYKNSQMFYTKK